MKVLAKDDKTGETSWQRVLNTSKVLHDDVLSLSLSVETARGLETIQTTQRHPFQVKGKGWVKAKDLKPGMVLLTAEGEVSLVSKQVVEGQIYAYDLTVENAHTFFVGASQVWVHNCPDPDGDVPTDGLKRAEAARDAKLEEISKLSNTKRNKVSTVVGAHDPATGKVAVGVKRTGCDAGKCAEDLAAEALGNPDPKSIEFTKVIRPRNEKIIPRCDRCTNTYGPEN